MIKIRNRHYRIISSEPIGHLGSRFYDQRKYTLEAINDNSRWVAYGKALSWNSKLSPAQDHTA